MKKQILSIVSLGVAAAAFAQVYITEKMPMPNVMSVTNEGQAVGYVEKNQPFYIWNPMQDIYKEIGGVSPGAGAGGAARFSESGLVIAAPMFSSDIPVNTDWVHSTVKEMEGMAFTQIEVVSGDKMYAVASNAGGTAGAIIRSVNSGASWRRYDYVQRENAEGQTEIVRPDFGITCFGAINHRCLIAGTSDGQILTDNGTGIWKTASLDGVESDIPVKRYISFNFTHELVNEYGAERAVNGCIAAELEDGGSILWYTDDKTATFHVSETAFEGLPLAIGNNGADFFMATTAGKIYISSDAGKTWTENFVLPEGLNAVRIVFADADNGVALCDKTIFLTRDGGETWTALTAPEAAAAQWKDAAWNGGQLMVVGADGSCLMTNDFGITFRRQSGLEGDLGAVCFKVSAEVYNVLGYGGEAYRITLMDKFSGYTAGLYDVERETWTALPGSGYAEGELVSSPWNISGDGRYVVGTCRDLDKSVSKIVTYATIWADGESVTPLPNMFSAEGKSCRANAVNFDGSIIAGWQDKFGPWFASLWTRGEDGTYTQKLLSVKEDFDPDTFDFSDKQACMEAFPGYCNVISPDGKWVGGEGDGATAIHSPWIWSEETGFKALAGDTDTKGTVTCLKADGSMALGWTEDNTHPWIWTERDGIMSLQEYVEEEMHYDLGDFELCSPYAMSPNGRYICGYGKRGVSLYGYVIDLDLLAGVENVEMSQVKAAVYPNPVAEELHVDLPFDSTEVHAAVTLADMQGRVAARLSNPAQSNVIDVRGLTPGVYVLTVNSESAARSFKVIVK